MQLLASTPPPGVRGLCSPSFFTSPYASVIAKVLRARPVQCYELGSIEPNTYNRDACSLQLPGFGHANSDLVDERHVSEIKITEYASRSSIDAGLYERYEPLIAHARLERFGIVYGRTGPMTREDYIPFSYPTYGDTVRDSNPVHFGRDLENQSQEGIYEGSHPSTSESRNILDRAEDILSLIRSAQTSRNTRIDIKSFDLMRNQAHTLVVEPFCSPFLVAAY